MKSNELFDHCMTAASAVAWLCLYFGLLLPGRFTTWPMWLMTIGASILLSFAIIFADGLASRRGLQVSKFFVISAAITCLLGFFLTLMPPRPPKSAVGEQIHEMKELLEKICAYHERLIVEGNSRPNFDLSNLTAMGVLSLRDVDYIAEKRIAYYGFPTSWARLESLILVVTNSEDEAPAVLIATNHEPRPPLRLIVFADGSGRSQKLSDPIPIPPAEEANALLRTGP